MGKNISLILITFLAGVFVYQKSLAQTTLVDSGSQQRAFNYAVALYATSVGSGSPLYNGPEYYLHDPRFVGNAYFLDVNTFTPGSVYYDGALYRGVPMLYDLFDEVVVVELHNHISKYHLINDKIKYFDLLNHHFINIGSDAANDNAGVKPGFYDELYGGKVAILAKRAKNLQPTTGPANEPLSYYNTTKSYFLRKNKIYYSFSGEESLLSVLKDKKKELRQYIKDNKIKYRKGPEDAMVKIVTYYDHLTN